MVVHPRMEILSSSRPTYHFFGRNAAMCFKRHGRTDFKSDQKPRCSIHRRAAENWLLRSEYVLLRLSSPTLMQTENEVWNQERLRESITEIMVLSFCSSIAAWFVQGQWRIVYTAILSDDHSWPPPEVNSKQSRWRPKKSGQVPPKMWEGPWRPRRPRGHWRSHA